MTKQDVVEFGEDAEEKPGPTDEELRGISARVQKALHLAHVLIPEKEAELAKLQADYKALIEVGIPQAMTSAEVSSFEYTSNEKTWIVSLAEKVVASITVANKEKAHAWLVKHGHGDLIKHVITMKFGTGTEQLKLFKKFCKDLAQRKVFIPHDVTEAVHAQTLSAFVREQRREAADEGKNPDEAVPMDLFSVYKITTTEFKEPKKKKVV